MKGSRYNFRSNLYSPSEPSTGND